MQHEECKNTTVRLIFSSVSCSFRVEEAEVVYPDGKTCKYPVLYSAQSITILICNKLLVLSPNVSLLLSPGLCFRSWLTGRRSCRVSSSTEKLASSKSFGPSLCDSDSKIYRKNMGSKCRVVKMHSVY